MRINPIQLRSIALLAFLSIGMCSIAQTPASTSTIDGSTYDVATNSTLGIHNFRKLTPEKLDYDEFDGSPYFVPDYVNGSLVRTNGSFLDSLSLNYDILLKSFVAKKDDGEEIFIDTRYCQEIRMIVEGEEIVFKRVDPRNPEDFYQIIYEGKGVTIYKDTKVSVVHGQNSGITKTNDRFFSKEQYLVSKDKQIFRIKKKKKDMWKHFSKEDVKLMERYLKENKVKLKKDKDYRAMFRILPSKA